MNVVLLSGGSGKRLWPLSNEIRSKQFIKFFKNENGEYESMVQRVYRQINSVLENADLTIATSRNQVSEIKNQLGDSVKICIEPCRRDTFPAIVLAVAYLHDEFNVGDEECIIVCPVDPYVEDSYYSMFKKMEEVALNDETNLTLMGIEPTYPSEKYGYIIPAKKSEISEVKSFKEKPNVEIAKKYIEEGALWNAGVFAFKVGYVLNCAHEMIEFSDYKDLYEKYEQLKKISFDYAFVEKEKNIKVVKYSGEWKDVGTWSTLSDVMTETTKGQTIIDDESSNVYVVNELSVPILCMGCKNMVIAASKDGILVSDKDCSGGMKPYVEKIEDDFRYAEKSWGTYTVLDSQPGILTIKLSLIKNRRMKYHSHQLRNETWIVLSGVGTATVDGMVRNVKKGDVVTMKAGCKHTISAITDMTLIEIQTGSDLSNADKIIYDMEF